MASDGDAPSRSVTHTEGNSYIVAFGHPELFPITASELFVFSPFPAAGRREGSRPGSARDGADVDGPPAETEKQR